MKFRVFLLLIIVFVASCSSITQESLRGIDKVSVQLSFDIDKQGKPINIKVLKTNHDGFRDQAKKDLSKWKYKPKMVNGLAVIQTGLTVQLDYKIEKPSN